MFKSALVAAGLTIAAAAVPTQAALVYDAFNNTVATTFTGSTPRTYMGQAFNIADPGTGAPVSVSSMKIRLVAGAAVSTTDSQVRIQFYQTYDPLATGTSLVFSNPLPLQTVTTGPVSTTGAAFFDLTVNFATPLVFNSLSNLGLAVNWQRFDGTNFVDDTNFTFALRNPATSGAIAVGSNATPGSGYFRNASGLTTLNFQAGDSRSLGTGPGGLIFSLDTVPAPASAALLGLGGVFAARRRRN